MITTKAILVNPTFSSWSGQRQDKKISEEIEDAKGAKHGSGVYKKHLIDPNVPDLKAVRECISQARQFHYSRTLPWGDDGARLLSSVAYMEYMEKMGDFKSQIEHHAAAFCRNYPAYKSIAKQTLNGLYNEQDYPEPEVLERKFSVRIRVSQVSDGEDLRFDIGGEEKAKIRAAMEEEVSQALNGAIMDVFRRMKEVVDDMLERLSKYAVDGSGRPQHPFRDSIVGNIRELMDIIPKLNVTNDPRITEMAQAINESLLVDPKELRDNVFVREMAIDKASELSKKLENMGLE